MIDHLFGNARAARTARNAVSFRLQATTAWRHERDRDSPLCCVSRLTGVSRRVPSDFSGEIRAL